MKKQLITHLLGMACICLLMTFIACNKDEFGKNNNENVSESEFIITDPNNPDFIAAPVQMKKIIIPMNQKLENRSAATSSIDPSGYSFEGSIGSTSSENVTATLNLPSVADVMFHFDNSGSMLQELTQVRLNAINIKNALATDVNELTVGVSHGIVDFVVDQNLTTDESFFVQGLNAIPAPNGALEDYGMHFVRLANDVAWRSNAAKTVVAFLDELPTAGGGGATPLIDGIIALKNAGIKLIVVFSGVSDLEYNAWSTLAIDPNCPFTLVRIIPNGDIPEGISIESFIVQSLEGAFCNVGEIHLETESALYQPWISSISPANYTDIDVCTINSFAFTINYQIPSGTPNGMYSFNIVLKGDNISYATHDVNVTVNNAIKIALDIHPGGCPNPLNTKSPGITPVAIAGSITLNVNDIDISTIKLNGVSPSRHSFEDVSTAYLPAEGTKNINDCSTLGADGKMDLTLKFNTPSLVRTLDNPKKGDAFCLTITGKLKNGTPFTGIDIVKIAN